MNTLGLALAFWGLGGLAALSMGRRHSAATVCGVMAHLGASVCAAVAAVATLAGGAITGWRWSWPAAAGEFHIGLDPLSAWFLLIIAVLSGVTAVYGSGYWQGSHAPRHPGSAWFFSNTLTAGMALVVVAQDALLFLLAWEIMTLASFFLVTQEDDLPENRRAGWIYLVASHLGAAFLLVFFLGRGVPAGTLDFAQWAAQPLDARTAGVWFLLAVMGFGVKAGFMPLHVWLPEAHPAAPSHISALMSGVMIKTGIYGLMRSLSFFRDWPAWWGWLLLAVGLVSGILGVLLALAQKDLKRLLAYSSVENIGLITLGMSLGMLGASWNLPALAAAGWAGTLLHALNHSLFKGLLFLGAGSVLHAAHTRNQEQLGGLLRRMPWTGVCFIVGAAAICGLPPLNGFLSEFLLYAGAIFGVGSGHGHATLAGSLFLAGLALIGGLAAVCFTKAAGIVFLGEPRSEAAARAHESGPAMRGALAALAGACVLAAWLAPWFWPALGRVALSLCPFPNPDHTAPAAQAFEHLQKLLFTVTAVTAGLVFLTLLAAAIRQVLLRRRSVCTAVTWDCGYAAPSARMQYTASSFVQPITTQFQPLLLTRARGRPLTGLFPSPARFATETPDASQHQLYRPLFVRLREALERLRWLQHGNVHLYVLYLALTLLALLLLTLR